MFLLSERNYSSVRPHEGKLQPHIAAILLLISIFLFPYKTESRFGFERRLLRKAQISPPDTGGNRSLQKQIDFLFQHKTESRFGFERSVLRKVEILPHSRRGKIGTCSNAATTAP